jgi:hypothetical protein
MKLALLSALVFAPGCGAMFHQSQKVTWTAPPDQKVVVYRDGAPLASTAPGTHTQVVLATGRGGFVAVAPGRKIARVSPGLRADALVIVGDALWTLTILGVAAPISDAALGAFPKIADHVDVDLALDDPSANPMPVYSVFGTTVDTSASASPSP